MDETQKDASTSNGGAKERNTTTGEQNNIPMLELGLYVRLEPSPGDVRVAKVEKCPFCKCQWYNMQGKNYILEY